MIQSIFSSLIAREATGFAPSLGYAENLIGDLYWLNLTSPSIEKSEMAVATEIPLTNAFPLNKKSSPEFDPTRLLLKMEPDTASCSSATKLMCRLEKSVSLSSVPNPANSFSNFRIQTGIAWEQHPHADSFRVECTEKVTLLLEGTVTRQQLPQWLAGWSQLVINFNQTGRGECQFYFHQFENGIIILGNNPVQADQKIYRVMLEKSPASRPAEFSGSETNLLEPLKSVISIKYNSDDPDACSIQEMDFFEKRVRTLEHRTNAGVGEKVAQF
jgi:hypothetical protein